jgi:trigger factor
MSATNTAPAGLLKDVSVERGEDGVVTLTIEAAADAVKSARERAIREAGRGMRVAGFRPGKVPTNIVLRNVGEEAIAQRVSDELLPHLYAQAVEQEGLDPLNQASVDQLDFSSFAGDEPLRFTARFIERPAIELPELSGLEATRPAVQVTEEDIERGLEALRAENATMKKVEGRGVENGDILSAELQVYIGGEAKSEEPTRLRQFAVGESGFVPEIDEHLLGAELDEERRFPVTYPEDFKDEELAGQEAEFAVKITSIRERILPTLDDEFSKKLGLEDVPALRERMRQAITEGRERESRESVRTQLVRAASEAVDFSVPAAYVDSRLEGRMRNIEHELKQQEATLEDYLKSVSQEREAFDTALRADVEAEARQELVLDAIAKREEFVVLEEEIEQHYRMLAQMSGAPLEDVVRNVDLGTVRTSILQRKAVDWLVDAAQISEGEAGAEDADDVDADEDAAEDVAAVPVTEEAGADDLDAGASNVADAK